MEYEDAINEQYGQSNLGIKILSHLKSKGIEEINSIQDALAPIEELHLRGSRATLELAQEVNLNETMKVLDIGCGIGGSARVLVSNFGCTVIGIDLCDEFCRAADLINKYIGYTEKIKVERGNALHMPFSDGSFDIVFIQHVLMNIENKKQVFSEAYRVLRPKGRLALNTICMGPIKPIYYPVIWANDSSISFLLSPEELREIINYSGFKEVIWRDNTKKVLEEIWRRRTKSSSNKPLPIKLEIIVPESSKKFRNMVSNLDEGRISVIQGVFERN